jgi:hypothetical protein
MKSILEAVYTTLTIDEEVVERVGTENIRRGWQEPVNVPSIRFYNQGMKSAGDDLSRRELIEETINVTVIAEGDIEVEQISDAVIKALSTDNVKHNSLVIHDCSYDGDNRGTFFDPLRKKHRKDLSFTITYSELVIA